jgi:hypothetical protein
MLEGQEQGVLHRTRHPEALREARGGFAGVQIALLDKRPTVEREVQHAGGAGRDGRLGRHVPRHPAGHVERIARVAVEDEVAARGELVALDRRRVHEERRVIQVRLPVAGQPQALGEAHAKVAGPDRVLFWQPHREVGRQRQRPEDVGGAQVAGARIAGARARLGHGPTSLRTPPGVYKPASSGR